MVSINASLPNSSAEKVSWTLSEKECDQLLDRSDLYVKWEEDRRQRKRDKEAKEAEEEERKMKEEGVNGEVEEEEDATLSLGPKVNGLFTVVDTSSGLTVEELS